MKRPFAIVVAIIVLTLAQGVRADRILPGKGPLHFTGQTPMQTLRLDIVPTRHTILNPGRTELTLFNSWTNRWNQSRQFLLDVEMLQNIMAFDIGLGKNTEVGISMPILTRSGGFLDGFIMRFHDALGLGQAGRRDYPSNTLSVRVIDDDGHEVVFLDESDAGTTVGDISLYARTQVYRGDGWLRSVIVSGLARFPTSNYRDYYFSDGTDLAVSVATSHRLAPFYVYTTLGYGALGSRSHNEIDLRPYQWTFFAAVEWPVSRKFSLIAQEMSNSSTASNFEEFSLPTHEITIGVKQQVGRHILLEYGVVENLFVFNNSVDLGFNFGITYRP